MSDTPEQCWRCKYWKMDYRDFLSIRDHERNFGPDFEMVRGDCHRRAPVAGSQHLSDIADILCDIVWRLYNGFPEERKEAYQDYGEGGDNQAHWPVTNGMEGCGEFELRTTPVFPVIETQCGDWDLTEKKEDKAA